MEFNALWENETFELTSLPEERTSGEGKWVYAIKPDSNGDERYEAGFSQLSHSDEGLTLETSAF